jgi:hypothetical protein
MIKLRNEAVPPLWSRMGWVNLERQLYPRSALGSIDGLLLIFSG